MLITEGMNFVTTFFIGMMWFYLRGKSRLLKNGVLRFLQNLHNAFLLINIILFILINILETKGVNNKKDDPEMVNVLSTKP